MEARRLATLDDLIALPPNLVGEIIGGVLHTHARPAPRHALAASVLGSELNRRWQRGHDGPGTWWILGEPELHLGGHVLVPDLAGWRRSALPALPETAHFALAPDWVCEVTSPSTARLDRGEKQDAYAEVGVAHLWIVDPLARFIEAFGLSDGRYVRLAYAVDAPDAQLPPFEATPFDVRELWDAR